jgi:hypothetical protein
VFFLSIMICYNTPVAGKTPASSGVDFDDSNPTFLECVSRLFHVHDRLSPFVIVNRWVVLTIGRTYKTMLIVTHLQYNVDTLHVRSIIVSRQDMAAA